MSFFKSDGIDFYAKRLIKTLVELRLLNLSSLSDDDVIEVYLEEGVRNYYVDRDDITSGDDGYWTIVTSDGTRLKLASMTNFDNTHFDGGSI